MFNLYSLPNLIYNKYMKTSVLVIAHNEEKYIEKCIKSLLQQTNPADEIVLVVHNSTDKTEVIAQKYPITIISYTGPVGIVYARLEGLKHVSGDIIMCTDGDSYVANNWCSVMKQTLLENNILVGSWVKFSGNLFGQISNFFNKFNCVKNKIPERWIWGPSFAFWGKDKGVVRDIFEKSSILSSELKLSRNPDDYWLALFMKQKGNLRVTNKTYVVQHPKEKNSTEAITRNKENTSNATSMEKYFKRIYK